MISAGERLARHLNESALPITALLWFYTPEDNNWRFVVGSPAVRDRGPKVVYQEIRQIVSQLPDDGPSVSLDDIFVIDSQEPLLQLLRTAAVTGDNISRIRFSRNVINGVLIEDAYIYLLKDA
jgi:hypothetical protein